MAPRRASHERDSDETRAQPAGRFCISAAFQASQAAARQRECTYSHPRTSPRRGADQVVRLEEARSVGPDEHRKAHQHRRSHNKAVRRSQEIRPPEELSRDLPPPLTLLQSYDLRSRCTRSFWQVGRGRGDTLREASPGLAPGSSRAGSIEPRAELRDFALGASPRSQRPITYIGQLYEYALETDS